MDLSAPAAVSPAVPAAQYRAVPVPDAPEFALIDQPAPQLAWVEIDRLVIDDRYQRPLGRHNIAAIKRIAAAFRWSRFAPVLVAPVPGGLFAIVDGQHRTHAAALCGVAAVPCQIVPMDRAEQARAFASVNGQQIKVSGVQIYRAALAAGEGWAVDCDAAAREAGCRLLNYQLHAASWVPGVVTSIAVIRDEIAAGRRALAVAGLRAIRQGRGGDRRQVAGDVLGVWFSALAADARFLRLDLVRFVAENDLAGVLDQARELRERQRLVSVTPRALARDALVELLRREIGRGV